MRDRRRSRWLTPLAALGALVALGACRGDELETAIGEVKWFSNMSDQVAVEPYEEPARLPPDGTVPVDAGVPLGDVDTYTDVPNPIAATAESLEIGKANYDIFCSVCHGPEGAGGGSVAGPFPRGLINSLMATRAREYTDGYLFGIISAGRGLMPNYRRIPQEQRWHIVNYVRQLQRQHEPPE